MKNRMAFFVFISPILVILLVAVLRTPKDELLGKVSFEETTASYVTESSTFLETTKESTTTQTQTATEPETTTKKPETTTTIVETTTTTTKVATTKPQSSWNGEVLDRYNGTIQGPSGKETYYNLNMSGVVSIMKGMGINYNYWIREDGVKMYGDYVMVAANLQVRPRGTIIQTSLGTGMACDTGGFAKDNPYQLDIAVNW